VKKAFLFLSISLFSFLSLFAQSKVRNALDTLQKFYPREKIYLFYDKSVYVAGETIWFSAFVFSGYELSSVSSNLFVELYDSEKKLLAVKRLPLLNGQASGQVKLSEKLNENVYFIRAYTQWMLNFPENDQYIHEVRVLNPKSPKKLQLQDLPWKAEVFPEGGNLIDGIPSKLSVRLFSSSPLPQKWSGYITEADNSEKIAEFTSLDQNAGIVQFLPFAGHQYQLKVEDRTGRQQVISLPAVVSSGTHLETYNFYDSIQYIIRFKNVPGFGKGYRLVGTMNDQLVYEAMIRTSGPSVSRFIPTANLYNGVLRLSLFDADDNVVAERLCFVKPTSFAIKTPVFTEKKLNSSPRSFNELQFQSDTIANPLSVMVLDAGAQDPIEDDNFLSALWLGGDLSKPIEKPGQYFNHPDSLSAEALDAVLISETWKDFAWKEILNNKYQAIKYFPDNYISYKATVYRNKKLVPNETVNLIFYFPDSSKQFVQAKTDNTGSFDISHLFFYDSAKVFFQLNQKKESAKDINMQFEILNRPTIYQQSFPATAYTLSDRPSNEQEPEIVTRAITTLNNQQFADDRYKTLQEVRVKSSVKDAKQKLDEELSSGTFRSFNETVFDFVNEDQHAEGYSNILQWLQGRVPGLQISTDRSGDLIPIIRGSQVGIYIDEMQSDAAMLNGFSISDIAMIKVIKGFFVGGVGGGGGGAIAIYTRKGNMRSANAGASLNSSKLAGYEKHERFPLPDYTESIYRQVKNDTRDVLYWNPFAVSENEQLKIPIRFYNNDLAKEFRVIIAGFTIDGTPVYYNEVLK
jgi:hypothetical protein